MFDLIILNSTHLAHYIAVSETTCSLIGTCSVLNINTCMYHDKRDS